MRRFVSMLLVSMLLAGCGAAPPAELVPIREYVTPATLVGPRPIALIVLAQQTPQPLLHAMCEGFLAVGTAGTYETSSALPGNTIALQWPLDIATAESWQRKDCGFLIARYDWKRATALLKQFKPKGAMGHNGPFIAFIASADKGFYTSMADASALVNSPDGANKIQQFPAAFVLAAHTALAAAAQKAEETQSRQNTIAWLKIGSGLVKILIPPADGLFTVVEGVLDLIEAGDT
ncbi:MAG: hypothetical protein WCI94_15435 [Rhodospirillales bacterium]